jgi:hypothetical protein
MQRVWLRLLDCKLSRTSAGSRLAAAGRYGGMLMEFHLLGLVTGLAFLSGGLQTASA